MAASHGRKTVFKITDSGSVLRDMTGYLTDVGFPRTVDTAETSTYGSIDKTYVVGLRDARVTLGGIFDNTAVSGPDVVFSGLLGFDTPTACQYAPAGLSGAGGTNVRWDFNAIVTSYEITSPLGDRVGFTAELQVSGLVSRTLV